MIVVGFIFIAIAVAIKYGKMYSLIAGYNTMPEKEKAKYDIKRMGNMMGNVFFIMAFLLFVGYFAAKHFDDPEIEWISLSVIVFLGIPYLLIRANSKKFKIDEK